MSTTPPDVSASRRVLASIMSAHASRILFHDRSLAEKAWQALADEAPAEVEHRPHNWLEQECQALYRFLDECWHGTGRLTQEGTASYDYYLWRERAAEMVRQAHAYGRSETIRDALDRDPARMPGGGVGEYLNEMCSPGYVFDQKHALRLRELLATRSPRTGDGPGEPAPDQPAD
jgi:hypothetical protein